MGLVEYSVFDARMRELVIRSAHVEQLDNSSRWAEGPVYFPAGDYLLWSDIPNNRVMQWVEGLGARVFSAAANNSNGNTCDALGRLVSCEHLSRSVVRFEIDGSRTVLADVYRSGKLNSPNDVVVASDQAIWFTDPSYGILSDYEGKRAASEQDGCFVYRIDPQTGIVEAKVVSMKMPNGLAFSPDETVLYVADSSRSHDETAHHHVLAFDVTAVQVLGEPRVFAVIEDGVPDGLRVDELGNVWVSSARGVEIFAPDGTPLGVLQIPEIVANLAFGGPKNNRLFIAATTSIYSVYTAVRGASRPAPRL